MRRSSADPTPPRRLYTRGGIMPDHPAGARRVFLRVAGEVGVAVHEHTGVQEVRGDKASSKPAGTRHFCA